MQCSHRIPPYVSVNVHISRDCWPCGRLLTAPEDPTAERWAQKTNKKNWHFQPAKQLTAPSRGHRSHDSVFVIRPIPSSEGGALGTLGKSVSSPLSPLKVAWSREVAMLLYFNNGNRHHLFLRFSFSLRCLRERLFSLWNTLSARFENKYLTWFSVCTHRTRQLRATMVALEALTRYRE